MPFREPQPPKGGRCQTQVPRKICGRHVTLTKSTAVIISVVPRGSPPQRPGEKVCRGAALRTAIIVVNTRSLPEGSPSAFTKPNYRHHPLKVIPFSLSYHVVCSLARLSCPTTDKTSPLLAPLPSLVRYAATLQQKNYFFQKAV